MKLHPSAHLDTFTRDNLPADDAWPTLTFSLPQLDFPARLNCATRVLDDSAAKFGGDRPCLIGPDEVWTYDDVVEWSNRIAHVLVEDFGVVPGNRVMLCGQNTPWQVACWFAVVKAGAVAVSVLPVLRPGELRPIFESAKVSHVLYDASAGAAVQEAAGTSVSLCTFGSGAELEQRGATKPAGFTAVETASDDVCMIAFTSGTTGKPKGCLHFHRDVLAIGATFSAPVLRPVPTDVFAGSPPLAFTFGLGGLVIFPLLAGASTVLLPRSAPRELAAAIAAHKVTVVFTAPTAYRAMLADSPDVDYRSLHTSVSAGEHLDAKTSLSWQRKTGSRMIDGIGSTELLHIFLASDSHTHPAGSTGVPVPGVSAKIVDESGNELPDDTAGLLAVRGPVGCRYLADERQHDYVRNGWNHTGDTYIRDEHGIYWYQSRADNLIISAGYNIAAHEIEDSLLRCPSVVDAAVVGVPDLARGQLVTAFVVAAQGFPPDDSTAEGIQNFVRHDIAPYKYPRVIHFVDQLPRTPTGKVQHFRLRELAAMQGKS
jgi:2-aminobenzoate-CoA ligase